MKACLGLVKEILEQVRHSFNVNVSVLGKGGAATNEVAEWSTALKGLSDADSEETILERMQNIVDCLMHVPT